MKIQIASDLHLEFLGPNSLPEESHFVSVEDRDILVLAGDVHVADGAKAFITRELEISPVIYVSGNHEHYSHRTRVEVDDHWKQFDRLRDHFHYLLCESLTIDGVRFYGAPWYSDLWGSGDPRIWGLMSNYVADFFDETNGKDVWTVPRHINAHVDQTNEMLAHAGNVDVVVTHWPPTKDAIHPRYRGDRLNPYFINNREDVVRQMEAKLWISGHTHEAYDYMCGKTRCIGNPAGYPDEPRYSVKFRPDLVVEI